MPEVKTEKVKLVTIIVPYLLEDRVAKELIELGATGYSSTKINGHGSHGPRKYSFVEGSNIKLEVLVHDELALKILTNLATRYSRDAIVAYALDVEAIPQGHFG